MFYHFCKEHPGINFSIPGMSIEDFTAKYYGFKVKHEDAEEAFMMALKNALIKPIMEFRSRMIYTFTDDALNDLMSDLYSFYILEHESSYDKWSSVRAPTEKEREGEAVFYSDKKSSERFFNRVEINRFYFKKAQKMDGESMELTKKIEENFRARDHLKNGYFKYIREKYDKTIKEYAFLLDGIFKIVFPLLL
jgi:hypothetical protein